MLFFDAHCDILFAINSSEDLFSNKNHWDAQRALSNGPFIQVFSLFAVGESASDVKAKMESQLKLALETERKYPDKLQLIRSKDDLERCLKELSETRVYGLIEAEGSEILGGSLEELEKLYESGLRILTLSWNNDNDVCDSVAGQNIHNGLSEFGRKVVEKAQGLGILIDVSHSSDKTVEDVLAITKSPIIASHSNARALCGHRRNLTDNQIKAIAKTGGVIGINLCPSFLNNSGNAEILDIIRHIEHISALAGTQYVGFGCDFDGIETLPSGITGVESMKTVIDFLLKLNYPEKDVEAIAGGNFVRLLKQIL